MTLIEENGMQTLGALGDAMSQLGLLGSSRFLPLFLTQGFGALNDNIFRNAVVVLVTYRLAETSPLPPAQLAAVATALVVLPYFLFSALAGQISDIYEKSAVIRAVKLAEVLICLLAAVAFAQGDATFLLGVLFLLGTQSAFFSPVKFAILPQHLELRELLGGNALLEMGTFLAILAGSILGTILILGASGTTVVSTLLIAIAGAGYLASRQIPTAAASAPDQALRRNLVAETVALLRYANQSPVVLWGILGIAWFWMIGGLYVTQLAPFTKMALGADQTVVTWLLALFTVGIGLGALLCNRLLNSIISPKYVLSSAIGISLFGCDLWFATSGGPETAGLTSLSAFLDGAQGLRVSADLFLLALCAGIYSVPLYALVQSRSDPKVRARTIASGNVIIAVFTVVGALATTALLGSGLSIQEVFAVGAAVNALGALLIHFRLAATT